MSLLGVAAKQMAVINFIYASFNACNYPMLLGYAYTNSALEIK